jgi:hypothetical protein
MTDQNQTVREDIAFLRGLAEAGRDRPMLGGAILAACGFIFGGASLAVWRLATYGMAGAMYPTVWGVAFLLYLAFLVPLLRRIPRTANGAQTAAGIAWSGSGWACFVIVCCLMTMSVRTQNWLIMSALPSIFLALYGSVWLLAANLWRKPWLYLTAVGSFAAALLSGWFASEGQTVWLVYGLSLVALLALPGLYLMRQSRTAA